VNVSHSINSHTTPTKRLSVGLGEARAGRVTAPLLGLAAAGVSDQDALVVGEEDLLDLGLLSLVGVLLEVRNEALSDSLAGSVGLSNRTTTTDGHVDLEAGVLGGANGVDGLEDLGAEGLGEDLVNRDAVDLDVALGRLGHRRDGDGGLLLTEGLDALDHVLLSGHGDTLRCFRRKKIAWSAAM
jgi:hypothetical protein